MKSRARYPGLRQFILIFAIAAPVWTIFFIQQNLLLALVPLFVSHALLLYPTLYPHSQWWGPVIRSFATSEKEVWITIDDGPTPEHTGEILDPARSLMKRARLSSSSVIARKNFRTWSKRFAGADMKSQTTH